MDDNDDSSVIVCSICCEEYSETKPPIEIKICKHYFHEKCLKDWADNCGTKNVNPSCPDCRQEYQKEDVKVNQQTLSLIIKNKLKINVTFIMISGEKMDLVLDQSKTVEKLFEMLVVYNKPHEQYNLQITVNQKQYTMNDKDKLINDLQFQTDKVVQVSKIEPCFQVFVTSMNLQTIIVKVKGSMTATEFTKIVSAQTGIPENQFFFTYGGKIFNSTFTKTLEELQIKKETTIFQVGRMNGG